MAIRTVSSIDELEQDDARFARKPNGRLKSNFHSRTEEPKARIREHDRYLEEMRQDARNWRREGNFGAAERAENQAAWEQADRVSTFSSRRRDLSSDPEVKDRYNERMLEADADCDLAEQRQYQSDQRHLSRWDELHAEQRREREAQVRFRREQDRIMADANKPLRDSLKGDELKKYEADREAYGKAMNRGRKGDYFERDGESERFDTRYRMHMLEWAEARHRREEQHRARGEEPATVEKAQQKRPAVASSGPTTTQATVKSPETGETKQLEEAPEQSQTSEQAGPREVEDKPADSEHSAQGTDGRVHSPVLASHEGFRAEVSDDQASIRYLREKDGGLGFTDHGSRVSVAEAPQAQKPDPDAVRAALMHASAKFQKFRVNGNREQQETSARMAERLGFGDKLTNPELQDIIRQEREQIAYERAEHAIREARGQAKSGEPQRGGEHGVGPQGMTPAESETQAADSQRTPYAETRPAESAVYESAGQAAGRTLDAESESRTPQALAARVEQATPQQSAAVKSEAKLEEAPVEAAAQAPVRELAKPAGYDERRAAQVAGESNADSSRALGEPEDKNERSAAQRAR